jgi:hypothetical protein
VNYVNNLASTGRQLFILSSIVNHAMNEYLANQHGFDGARGHIDGREQAEVKTGACYHAPPSRFRPEDSSMARSAEACWIRTRLFVKRLTWMQREGCHLNGLRMRSTFQVLTTLGSLGLSLFYAKG